MTQIKEWMEIGKENSWIKEAYDPPFNEDSFYICRDVYELVEKLSHGNWSLGTAFVYRNLAFINQINGGDEWLVIRDHIPFESWSCGYTIQNRGHLHFIKQVYKMLLATEKEIRNLTYAEVEIPPLFHLDSYTFSTH